MEASLPEFSGVDHVRIRTADGRIFLVPRDPTAFLVPRDPTAILVPTAEFINPYADLSDEEKERIMEHVEPPKMPVVSTDEQLPVE